MELGAATETEKVLCDAACMARVDSLPETVTPSGLKFRDIAVGKGPTPPTGYQARPPGCRRHAALRRRLIDLMGQNTRCSQAHRPMPGF